MKKLSDIIPRLKASDRLYVSVDTWVDREGKRRWEGPLTEAQMYAYWSLTIGKCKVYKNDKFRKVLCIVYAAKEE